MNRPRRRERPIVGMALYGDLTYDSRVRREAATLAGAGFDVTIACLAGEKGTRELPRNVKVLVLRPSATAILPGGPNPFLGSRTGRLVAMGRRVAWLRDYVRNLRSWGRMVVDAAGPIDIWHVHDLTGLAAVAPRIGPATPLVYDAHELFLETGTALKLPRVARSMLRAYERRLVSRASAVVTVNDALAAVLQRRYRPTRILAVHNCPDRWSPPTARPRLLSEAAGIPEGAPVILYHGALSVDRGVEQLMAALLEPGLETAHLVLLGFGEMRDRYVSAAADPLWGGRAHVLDPVPPAELLPWIASADVGAMPIQPSTLNHRLSTPNKLFECMAAGVPVVVSDFQGMRRIVTGDPAGPIGVVCDPTRADSIAAAIRSLLDLDATDMEAYRARCLAAAHAHWNWETQAAGLVRLYEEMARDLR
jgi:glycosyltransferase involved in cell wall biosynthesis